MSLTLYFHPLASFCWKALLALYENETPFVPHLVDLGDADSRASFTRIWPIAKFPVLRDEARARTIPESSMIIEHLARHYRGRTELIPADPELAWQVRASDRFYDLYVHQQMQKIVTDRIRPPGKHDPYGVDEARRLLRTAYDILEPEMAARTWAVGDAFTMADCAAAPALFYANRVAPLANECPNLARYLARLMERPCFARTRREAEPYFKLLPA